MSPLRNKPEPPLTTVDVQLELITCAFREKGITIRAARTGKDGPDGEGGLDFVYQDGVILVRDAYLRQVADVVGGGETVDGLVDGVTLFSLAKAKKIRAALDALAEIDRLLGVGVATPNHILSICPVSPCPATEPEVVPGSELPDPGVCDDGGRGVFIYVPDTGLLAGADAHPWLAGVTGQPDRLSGAPGGGVEIDEYTGHGTFVAGVARCMAPGSTVKVVSDFNTAGALSEDKLIKRLDEALGLGPDIISLSAGGTTRKNLPLLSFEGFWHRYRQYKGTVLVAAAGNNGTRRPFWPAAFPEVVGVGAVAANWRSRANFSDYGPWVDVYAPGTDLVNAYATGTYICREPPNTGQQREFHGMARWSGTSFSTPLVSGLIAARVSRTGENARLAADSLLALARAQPLAGVGPVLWPCQTGGGCCGDAGCGGHADCGCAGCGCAGCGCRAGCGCAGCGGQRSHSGAHRGGPR
jgi:subtilisin family serine protease